MAKEGSKSQKKRVEVMKKASPETSKGKVKPIYADSDKQSIYDELRADGKTDTQARQIVVLKSR